MANLNIIYNEAIKMMKYREELQSARNLDGLSNMINVVYLNLEKYITYYKDEVMKLNYQFRPDTEVVIHLLNYPLNLKSYINRKKYAIDKLNFSKRTPYKNDLHKILYSHYKKDRNQTYIDKVVQIRNKLEHEKISDISLTIHIDKELKKELKFKEYNLTELYIKSYEELEIMNKQFDEYIKSKESEIDLRHYTNIYNAVHRHLRKEPIYQLYPVETPEELEKYDAIVRESLK